MFVFAVGIFSCSHHLKQCWILLPLVLSVLVFYHCNLYFQCSDNVLAGLYYYCCYAVLLFDCHKLVIFYTDYCYGSKLAPYPDCIVLCQMYLILDFEINWLRATGVV